MELIVGGVGHLERVQNLAPRGASVVSFGCKGQPRDAFKAVACYGRVDLKRKHRLGKNHIGLRPGKEVREVRKLERIDFVKINGVVEAAREHIHRKARHVVIRIEVDFRRHVGRSESGVGEDEETAAFDAYTLRKVEFPVGHFFAFRLRVRDEIKGRNFQAHADTARRRLKVRDCDFALAACRRAVVRGHSLRHGNHEVVKLDARSLGRDGVGRKIESDIHRRRIFHAHGADGFD